MNETAFVDRRKTDWGRLSFLCDKAERSLKQLSADEFEELVNLYRRASTDLASVRTKSKNLQLAEFLNDLVARAYGTLYTETRGSFGSAIGHGIRLAAQTVRRRKWFVIASASLFFGSALWAYMMMSWVPETRETFVPPGWEETFKHWRTPFEANSPSESAGATFGLYMANNPKVAVISGAVSVATFGFGTMYLLYQSGAMLGALAKDLEPYGQTGRMLTWVAPHGVPEMSGMIIAGGAGFLIAWCLINPGRKRRGQALRDAGKDVIVLLTTGACMMFIAAPIEGFFSFNPNISDPVKLAVAGVSLAAWLMFWSGYGKDESELALEAQSAKPKIPRLE